jgi:AcrR family transcriptional regulator
VSGPRWRTVPSPGQQERRDAGPLTGKGRARKAVLLDAAERVFERMGFTDARVSDIVAEARVAQGTFYTYFDSKDAIFRAVATRVVGEMLVGLHRPLGGSSLRPHQRARLGVERFVDAYRPRATIIALIEQAGISNSEMRALRMQVREAFVDRLARDITEQQAYGVADPSVDPVLIAEALGAMVDHISYVWFTLGRDFERESLLDTLAMVWVRAIAADGGVGAAPMVGERSVPTR